MEEPPAKVTKFEMDSQYLEGDVMEEGQEEWLSEGILTDDDYNPASQQTEPDCSDSNVASQDETMNSASADDSQNQLDSTQYMDTNVSNIEETLNNLENSENNNQASDFPEELNAFLIRKTDGKVVGSDSPKKESDVEESVKQSDDDGNDTDDLLRVLGDSDQPAQQSNKEKGEIKTEPGDSSDDDDNYIFEGKKNVKNSQMTRTVLTRATALKAEPEDDPTDCSSDEGGIVKTISTNTNKKSKVTPQITTSVKPGNLTISPLKKKEEPRKMVKKFVNITQRINNKHVKIGNNKDVEVKRAPESPRRQYVNKHVSHSPRAQPPPARADAAPARSQREDFTPEPKERKPELRQRLVQPEGMDEEVPTDDDSGTEEEDLYSELPSSDSDIEDWFTLDIRTERAGDYIPLLGDKAYQLLTEERRRVKTRLDTLKNSLSSLASSGRDLADQLRDATNTVAELDAMLKVV